MTRDKASEGGAGPGSPMTPGELPDEATPADRAKPKAVPIGPVSREQFEKLKKEAEKRRPPRQGQAQENPAEA